MKLDTRAFATASAVIAAVLFVICALFVALAPRETTAVAGYLIHVNVSGMTRSLTWGSFIGGLVGWTVGTGVVGAALAWVYNRLVREAGP
jgi:hypothetical protein